MTDPAFPVSLESLGVRYSLDADALARLAVLASMLSNDPLAPTTVREPAAVRDDHLADSLVALEFAEVRAASILADLGAGAGLPGLPLAIALPTARLVLVESNSRKCEFLRRAVECLGLSNVEIARVRAEAWTEGFGSCEVVTARALARLDVVEEYAAPLLRAGGTLVAWRGKRDLEVEAAAARAGEILGLEASEPVRVMPYDGAESRYLHLISKVRETPPRFPRREGMATKRPLGQLRRDPR